jgi:Ca-activated chloride channel family protein
MKKIAALLWVAALAVQASGCREKDNASAAPAVDPADPLALSVLAGSELKDIEPLLPQVQTATGVRVVLNYAGTLEAVERLQSGDGADAAWLASNRYAMLTPAVKARVLASERTMLTPVVLGLRSSKAAQLGWDQRSDVTWKEIAAAAGAGKFTFGMTNPSSSNSGFAGLLGLAAALSGKGDALEAKDVDSKGLAQFFKAQRLTAGSSGWLAEAYLRDQAKVDGLINYASTLSSLNANPALNEKLVLIYPKDGIVTADYPIMLLNGAKREAYDKVVAYLRGQDFQTAMAQATGRRPVNPDAQAPASSQPAGLPEISFPAKLDVVDAILASFDNELRLPADSTFVLDRSGSMGGERMAHLKTAMRGLTGSDATISGRFAKFRDRERIRVVVFNGSVEPAELFAMGADRQANAKAMAALSARVEGLSPMGGTALFEATRQAYLEAAARRRAEPERFYSIVLMTDGENSDGLNFEQFHAWLSSLPEADRGVKVFPILFGEGNPQQLAQVAALTGGRLFDGRKASLSSVFKDIRGYQ